MRTTIFFLTLSVMGCGGSGTDVTVAGDTFTIRDSGYFFSDGRDYCAEGGAGQMLLKFVDYNFICDPNHPPDLSGTAPHSELRIILTQGPSPDFATHPNMMLPYDNDPSVTPNCDTGPGDVIIGQYLHYPNGDPTTVPDKIVYASSAHLQFTAYDKTKTKPNTGNYDLKFGANQVKGSFSIFNCN